VKKKLTVFLLMVLVLGGVAAVALGGSSQDPLLSQEYLSNQFKPTLSAQVQDQVNGALKKGYDEKAAKLDAEAALYRSQLAGSSGTDAWSYLPSFTVQKRSLGDAVQLRAGSGLLFLEGAANASAVSGELIDVTDGTASSSLQLKAGHRYLVGEGATVTITVQSDACKLAVVGDTQHSNSGQAALPFTDLTQSDWFYKAAQFTYEKKLFNGVSEDHFAPQGSVTRAMLATILYRVAGEPLTLGSGGGFTDVLPGQWYEQGIRWSAQAGIVNGMGDGSFAPGSNVTREQLAVMLYRYAGEYAKIGTDDVGDLERFGDRAGISAWAEEGLTWAVGAEILNGDTSGNLKPKGFATRAEAATMIQRFYQLLQ